LGGKKSGGLWFKASPSKKASKIPSQSISQRLAECTCGPSYVEILPEKTTKAKKGWGMAQVIKSACLASRKP
jgi:hypothetical protein